MKKQLYAVLIFILVIVSLDSSLRNVWAEEPVYFPDPNFKVVIEESLGITDPTPNDMIGLTYLNASIRGIVDITGIGYAVNLKYLNLSGNPLSSLPAEIGNLTSLTSLSLSNNQLSSLPAEIGNLTSLTGLGLDNNQLSSLPPEIGNLTSLTGLGLDNNQLNSLPAEIGNPTSLTGLGLSNNYLSNLPAEIGNLASMTELYLDNNQLNSLPADIGNLTSLTGLYLYGNQLSILPVDIGNLTNLTELHLQGNPLNTEAYCSIIPIIIDNNPGMYYIDYDPNPNPLTNDCFSDLLDFGIFQNHWLESDCGTTNNWCGGADLNHINNVDLEDVAIFTKYWLAVEP